MMKLITRFTCPPTICFKFITKCDKCYYKVRQVLQSVTILLQSATGITKCDDYYKVRQYTPLDSPVRAIDLHPSKPFISLVPISCTTYCFSETGALLCHYPYPCTHGLQDA